MNKFIIYSKKRCSYCVAAKSLLNSKNIKFIEKMVDESEVDFNEMKNKAITIIPTITVILLYTKLELERKNPNPIPVFQIKSKLMKSFM